MTKDLVPPSGHHGVAAWVRQNLFRTRGDSIVTVIAGVALGYVTYRTLRFVFVTGRWSIIEVNLENFMVGRTLRGEVWRPVLSLLIATAAGGLLAGLRTGPTNDGRRNPGRAAIDLLVRVWPFAVFVGLLLALAGTIGPVLLTASAVVVALAFRFLGARAPRTLRTPVVVALVASPLFVVLAITAGGGPGWDEWNGLVLTLFLAISSISLSFPFGVLLALGRRSTLPAVRAVSVGYIELFRGVPLVALLLMGSLLVGFFLPADAEPGDVTKAIVVFTIFTAAYVAEIVRGGLQSLPRGQAEAGVALGLSPVRVTALIVLPQALKAVIPALVGQFISLFKDTSLVAVIGFTEILGLSQIIIQQDDFRGEGLITESLLFAAFVFWVGSYTMSRESQRLEQQLGVGTR